MKYIDHSFPWTKKTSWAWADDDAKGRLPASLLGCIDDVNDDIEAIMWHVINTTEPAHGGKTWNARTCIQAGAACGIWPFRFAQMFQSVITVEPVWANFEAAKYNLTPVSNVRLYNMGFGETEGESCKMTRPTPERYNCGAWHVDPEADDDTGLTDLTTIDFLAGSDDEHVDLIALDLEGYELFALRGATNVIAKHLPVIYFEDKGHCRKFGVRPGAVQAYLKRMFGYSVAEELKNNTIMTAK